MSYYKDKRRAIHIIDKMLKDGASETEIERYIGLKFGFGRKLIEDRARLLKPENENN